MGVFPRYLRSELSLLDLLLESHTPVKLPVAILGRVPPGEIGVDLCAGDTRLATPRIKRRSDRGLDAFAANAASTGRVRRCNPAPGDSPPASACSVDPDCPPTRAIALIPDPPANADARVHGFHRGDPKRSRSWCSLSHSRRRSAFRGFAVEHLVISACDCSVAWRSPVARNCV